MDEPRVVLITGASSGLGLSTAQLLAERGFVVFGTSRNPSCNEMPLRWDLLQLDVSSDQSVRQCIDTIITRAGRIDILINNAGYALDGALEEATIDQVKAQFEVNFLGVVRVVNATLPVMRRQRSGQIINISSEAALARIPFEGYYTATKCALEGYSETLRNELRLFGISVSIIQPSFYQSNFWTNIQLGEHIIHDYEPRRTRILNSFFAKSKEAHTPQPVAECVYRVVTSKKPHLYYPVGITPWWQWLARRTAPQFLFDWGTRANFQLEPNRGTDKSLSRRVTINERILKQQRELQISARVKRSAMSREKLEVFLEIYRQNWEDVRHLEGERLMFTTIYAVIVAGVLGFIAQAKELNHVPLLAFLAILSILGLTMSLRLGSAITSVERKIKETRKEMPEELQSLVVFGGEYGWTTKIKLRFLFPALYVSTFVLFVWMLVTS